MSLSIPAEPRMGTVELTRIRDRFDTVGGQKKLVLSSSSIVVKMAVLFDAQRRI